MAVIKDFSPSCIVALSAAGIPFSALSEIFLAMDALSPSVRFTPASSARASASEIALSTISLGPTSLTEPSAPRVDPSISALAADSFTISLTVFSAPP